MSFFVWQWWRLAIGPGYADGTVRVWDPAGRWRRVCGRLYVLVSRGATIDETRQWR